MRIWLNFRRAACHVRGGWRKSQCYTPGKMQPTSLTTDPQTLTAAGPAAPTAGLAISGLTGDYTLEITVSALSAASGTPKARVVLEDTVNGFTNAVAVVEMNIQGPIGMPVTHLYKSDEAPSLRIGVASAMLRLNVYELDGTSPTITVHGAIWQ